MSDFENRLQAIFEIHARTRYGAEQPTLTAQEHDDHDRRLRDMLQHQILPAMETARAVAKQKALTLQVGFVPDRRAFLQVSIGESVHALNFQISEVEDENIPLLIVSDDLPLPLQPQEEPEDYFGVDDITKLDVENYIASFIRQVLILTV